MKNIESKLISITLFLFTLEAYAQNKAVAIGGKVAEVSHGAAGGLDKVSGFLASKEGMVMIGLGFLFGLAKRVSTEEAGPVVQMIQQLFDGASELFVSMGKLLKIVSEFLAKMLASDGYLGKK